MDVKQLNKMRTASYLLPDPGGEVARELIDEITDLQADTTALVEALDFSQGAIVDAIGCEDGLDGATGYAVLLMLWPLLDKHGESGNPEQRKAFAKMYSGDGRTVRDCISRDNERLEAENETLRRALSRIANNELAGTPSTMTGKDAVEAYFNGKWVQRKSVDIKLNPASEAICLRKEDWKATDWVVVESEVSDET